MKDTPGARRRLIINFVILTALFAASMAVVYSANGNFTFIEAFSFSNIQNILIGCYVVASFFVAAEAYLTAVTGQ